MPKILELCAVDITVKDLLLPLIDKLEKEGYEVEIACSRGEVTETLEKKGYVFKFVNIDRKVNLISNFKSIIEIYKIARKGKYDIVHVHTPAAGILGRIAAKLAATPLIIYTAHGFYFHEGMSRTKYNIVLKIEKYLAKYFTDFIFTQSEEDGKTALENHFIDKNKILTISNGVDTQESFNPINIERDKIDELYKEFNLERNDKIITFVGRLVQEKGVMDLLEAFNGANFNDEAKVKLLIVGGIEQSERDRDTIKKLEKYSDNPNVIFTGHRDDINSILYITDVFCLPSYREGMPRSIIEAMAMECAVVATDIRGSREEVIDGKTGFLVPVNSINNLSDKIKELAEDEKLLKKMKNAGRRRAEKLFDEKEIVEKQLEIFSRLLNPRQIMSSEPIKICVITTVSITLRAFLLEQLVYLSQNGFDVTVVCEYDPIFVRDCPPELKYIPVHMTRKIGWWSTLVGWWKLYRLFKREKFRMIQYSTPKAALISSLAGFIAGIPIRLYCQWGIYYVGSSSLTKKVFKSVEKLTCFFSTDIAPDSNGNLEFAIREDLYPRKKGSVIYNGSANGVNLKKFDIAKKRIWRNRIKAELNLNESSFVYGFVGRITKDKGINELINVFQRLAQNDSGIFLILVGMEEEEHRLNPAVVEVIHNHPQIRTLGWKANVAEYMAVMDVILLPSYREGFGIVAIEAQAMGVPIITTDIPGPRDAIINGKTGILIPAANEESLMSAIHKLENNRDLLKSMGDKGILFVRENFEQRVFWEKVLEHRMSLLTRMAK
ncbi:glycosyltransferase family 1 protein [Candidatus Atribacteria bacterium 1244-E10-H5-B2]|nr:MAG: glycosyltransferase family 1 protein [Candidatus Atribacteria bacterium 1244-E10-H5-B2]